VFLDAWTPEVSPRVVRLRESGVLVSCLADVVLARAGQRVLGVTGTAGKTTTTSIVAQLLATAGLEVALPAPGLSANLWPDASLLDAFTSPTRIVMELTSSHLAFCRHSPQIAVVTSFWPDHVELHGSFDSYRRAKETIAREQSSDGWLIVPDDGSCESFVAATRARTARFSPLAPVDCGAFLNQERVVVRWNDEEHQLIDAASLPLRGDCVANALAACTAALVAGVPPAVLADALRGIRMPPHRFVEIGRFDSVPVYDDSMAGTPAKARAALELFPDDSIVLVAGGETLGAAGPVHATEAECELLEGACALARRKARRTILFGPAAARLGGLLPPDEEASTIEEAVERAVARASGARAILIAPMFPVSPEERTRIATRSFRR